LITARDGNLRARLAHLGVVHMWTTPRRHRVCQNEVVVVDLRQGKPPACEGRMTDFGWMGWRVEEAVDLRRVRLAEAEVVRGPAASANGIFVSFFGRPGVDAWSGF